MNWPIKDKLLQAAKKKADEVLSQNLVIEPPVRVTDIARNYGFLVEEVDLGMFGTRVGGFIDPKQKIIYVNKKDGPNRQAFTIAHELGHWLMHEDKLLQETESLNKAPKYAVYYRTPLGAPIKDPIEKQANAFAANLLVPRGMLKKYKDVSDISSLAKIFGVSEDLVGLRLKDEFGEFEKRK